jgi:hypothetical protein
MKQEQFTDLSKKITKKLNKKTKQQNGIFFTPQSIIKTALDKIINKENNKFKNILEPSCGTGEFINIISNKLEYENIDCIEYVKDIYDEIKSIYSSNNKINIVNDDFLQFNTNKKYDLIIGNPPYYVLKKTLIDTLYNNYYNGRPNIFIIFILKCLLNHLSNNGILCFVIPNSFLNTLWYNNTRKLIYEKYEIIDIIHNTDDTYLETQQDTITLIIKKSSKSINDVIKHNKNYSLIYNNMYILNNSNTIIKLKELLTNYNTLESLGYELSIGNCVWNQNKNLLTDNKNKTKLIYSSNIKNNTIVDLIKTRDNDQKKQFIDLEGIKDNTPLLLLNRGHGSGKYQFNYCIFEPGNKTYLLENHVISIKDKSSKDNKEKILNYKKIINSFNNDKTKEFISLFIRNGGINTTELKNIIPIYGWYFYG